MKRRDFIQKLGLAAFGAPFVLNGLPMRAMQSMVNLRHEAKGRVLILIRLNGGNDGLNTIVPIDQYSNLNLHRPNIIIPEKKILSLTDEIGLHPSMKGMQNMFSDDKLGIIQGVGYSEQNRSHFRSTDIWTSGLIDEPATSGWLGRKFQSDHPSFPSNYPSDSSPHPFAISMGKGVSETCQGTNANFSHTVNDPTENFDLDQGNFIDDGSCHSNQLKYINQLINQTNLYGSEINDSAALGTTLSKLYDDSNELAVQFRNVAKLISGGLQTSIYILNLNGFDTHGDQVNAGNPTEGVHAELMKILSDAVEAFQDDLRLLNLEDRVVGLTFSEFGRQISSNASYGTDHGDAAPMILFGSCLDFKIMGDGPSINSSLSKQEGVAMAVDFRNIYASLLKDWFGMNSVDVQSLFEHEVHYLSLIKCSLTTETNTNRYAETKLLSYPNPVQNFVNIKFSCHAEWVRVSILDSIGNESALIFNSTLNKGVHNFSYDLSSAASGQYIISVVKNSGSIKHKFSKL